MVARLLAGNALISRYNLVMFNNKDHCGAPFQVSGSWIGSRIGCIGCRVRIEDAGCRWDNHDTAPP